MTDSDQVKDGNKSGALAKAKDSLPDLSKKQMLATAAGVAAAAAVGIAAVKKIKDRSKKAPSGEIAVFHLGPAGERWQLKAAGADQAVGDYDTKKEALTEAREHVRSAAPSRLVVHRQDGTIQDSFEYED